MGMSLQNDKIFIAPASFTDYAKFTISLPKKEKIVFSGRLEKIKNPFLALEAAGELVQRGISFRLAMLGRGSLLPDLKKYVKENGLNENVDIFYTAEVDKELKDALIYLSLQKENNYPSQALLEAMACGCIPIATDVGETRKIVDEDNGFLVNEDAHKIADIICHILENRGRFEVKGAEIRDHTIKRFNIDGYLKYYRSLFQF